MASATQRFLDTDDILYVLVDHVRATPTDATYATFRLCVLSDPSLRYPTSNRS